MNAPRQTIRPTRRHATSGFSLVELLVVIAIILVLVGIGVAVQKSARDNALLGQSRLILQQAMSVLAEYRTQVGSVPTETAGNIVTFVQAVKGNPTCQQMLSNMGADVYDRANDKIKDAWGKDLRYYSSASGASDNIFFDTTTNAAIPSTDARRNRPLFLSAGPDNKFGDESGSGLSQARDNLYSFDIK